MPSPDRSDGPGRSATTTGIAPLHRADPSPPPFRSTPHDPMLVRDDHVGGLALTRASAEDGL
eukprot:5278494-Alexandrium_andersonii.AAC.1